MKKLFVILVLAFCGFSSLLAQTEQGRLVYERNRKTGYQDLITNPEHAKFDTLSILNLSDVTTADTVLTVEDGLVKKTAIVDISQTQVVEFLGVLSSAPLIYKEGDIYYNSTDSKIYIRANNLWIALN